ncbi:MAG: hypothetical protein WC955_08250 [Elusimicrobiota bacterium]
MEIVKLLVALVLLLIGTGYYFFPNFIIKINEFAKKYLFNDAYIVKNRRKAGALLILLAILLAYSGFVGLVSEKNIGIPGLTQNEVLLYKASQLIYAQQYDDALTFCNEILREDPKNVKALIKVGMAHYLKGERQQGVKIWLQVLKLDPKNKELIELLRTHRVGSRVNKEGNK